MFNGYWRECRLVTVDPGKRRMEILAEGQSEFVILTRHSSVLCNNLTTILLIDYTQIN